MESHDLPFGLAESQVRPVVEAVAGEPVTDFSVESRSLNEGHSGSDKQLCTFRYTTREGRQGAETLFVKRCVWKGRSEAVHYVYLASVGVPTPRLYGAVTNSDGEEIIFLERLSAIGFYLESPMDWRRMLSLMARFNACRVAEEYALHLHSYEQVGAIDGGLWITGLAAKPRDAEIEASLRDCGVDDGGLPTLQSAAHSLFAEVAAQPRGLLHQDFFSDNLGWRGAEMVVFDIHKNALGPRFADAAPYLGTPDWSNLAAFLDAPDDGAGSRREALTRHYLEEYARFGGEAVPVKTFQEEARALFWAHKVTNLGWLREHNKKARIREVLDVLRTWVPRGPYPSDTASGTSSSP
jgi:hypothetical protein